jgi:hypothetical protein
MAEPKKPAVKKTAEPKKPAVKKQLVEMVRDDGKTADVHPDEVDNFKKGNWRIK